MDRTTELETLVLEALTTYLRTEALTDFELVTQGLRQVLDLMPDDHSKEVHELQDPNVNSSDKHGKLRALGFQETCIQHILYILNLIPEDHTARVARLQDLGARYSNRYRQTEILSDLELSILIDQEVLDRTPDDCPDRADRIHNLAVGYNDRYERTGEPSDLELSIERIQEALDLTAENDPSRADRLQNLGIGYKDRYQRTGSLVDLDLSIRRKRDALNLTSENDPNRAGRLQSLGLGYRDRYRRTGALSDLELSVHLRQEALDLTPEDNTLRAGRLQDLGTGYNDRYRRTESLEDLELCIQRFQQALDLTSEDHPDRAGLLQDLGTAYNDLYERTGALSDLESGLELFQEALSLTAESHPKRAGRLQSLGVCYNDRYQRTRALSDLEFSIQNFQQSLDLTPENHPDQSDRLRNVGIGHKDLYERTGVAHYLELSIQRFQEALNSGSSPPLDRLRAGRDLFEIYTGAENWQLAYDTAFLTVPLIPLITSRSLERSDLQHQVNEITGLASDAAAVAIKAVKPLYEALQLLDIGRGVIANSLGDIRTDTTELDRKFPDLAEQFNNLRDLLDTPKGLRQDDQRYNTGKQLEGLIQKIRALPSFDRFLLGPSEDDLKRAAVSGHIIVINVSKYGCHALIIKQNGFQSLELPLDIGDIRFQAGKLADPDIEMLEWLWDKIASRVLDAINFVQSPTDTWPRVWWVLTGPLARFPIHAAGHYSDSEIHDTVMDCVISSYSSSVRAITNVPSNTSAFTNVNKPRSIVLVGMRDTPEHTPLQFVSEEIEMLARLGLSMQLQVKQPPSYRKEILSAMDDCEIFHFAGHGYTDALNPSNSALILSDGRLTVDSIFDTNLRRQKPFLAYLSACGTGQMKHSELVDEGLHLIGAFQLAGFKHVIGTLWEVNDKFCVDVVKETYRWIQEQDMSDRSVGEGLHRACRRLRDHWVKDNNSRKAVRRGLQSKQEVSAALIGEKAHSASSAIRNHRDIESVQDLPLHWIPYVHFGA